MDFMELAKARYSVRSFKPDPVSQEAIDRILEAGMIAPTACNNQPQKIIVLNNKETLEKIKKCTSSHFNSPLVFVVGYDKNICWTSPFNGKPSGDIDASIVTTHMMLEAAECGVGSTWVMYFDPEALKTEFALSDNIEPTALLVMGYPSDEAKPNPRHTVYRDPSQIVTYNA